MGANKKHKFIGNCIPSSVPSAKTDPTLEPRRLVYGVMVKGRGNCAYCGGNGSGIAACHVCHDKNVAKILREMNCGLRNPDGTSTEEEVQALYVQGYCEAVQIVVDAMKDDAIPEDVCKVLWEECTDTLMRQGYWERDGAKLIKAGVVPIKPESIPNMPDEMKA